MGETGAPSEPHRPCTGLCLLFANKTPKAWPKDQLVLGDAGLQVSLLVQGMGLQHPLRAPGHLPHSAPPTPAPTPPHDVWLPGNPLLPPITLSGERARRGPGQDSHGGGGGGWPSLALSQLPWKQKKTPLHSPTGSGVGLEAFPLLFWVE